MTLQTITLELSEPLYRSARQLAAITKRPLEEIVRESLTHTLPPLDDVEPDQAETLAKMSTFDDTRLWQHANQTLTSREQSQLETLLDLQSADNLSDNQKIQLQELMDKYGRLLVQKSHAWLLLARRGYNVPVQKQ